MADSSRVKLIYGEESTFGTPPAAGNWKTVLITDEGLTSQATFTDSNLIRSDRQVADSKRTNIGSQGPINSELFFAQFDDWFEAVLQADATFTAEQSHTGAAPADYKFESVAASPSNFARITNTPTDLTTLNLIVGGILKISGSSEAANNRYARIVSIAASAIEVEGEFTTDDGTGDTVTITQGGSIKNGTTKKSFAIERENADLTNVFRVFTGLNFNNMSMTVTPAEIVTVNFETIGKFELDPLPTVTQDATPDPAPSNTVMNAVDNVPTADEAGAGVQPTQINFTVTNNLRSRSIVGALGPDSIGVGRFQVSGTLERYFPSTDILTKFINNTYSSLLAVFEDENANAYAVSFPRVRFNQVDTVTPGPDTDILESVQWAAIREPNEDATMRIAKWTAP